MDRLRVDCHPEGAVVSVWVQPRSRRPGIAGLREGDLHIRVAAPPEDGRANDEVCRLLAGALGIRPRDLRILGGLRSRSKRVLVTGIDPAGLVRRLAGGPGGGAPGSAAPDGDA